MPMQPIFADTFRSLNALRNAEGDVHMWMLKRLVVLAAWEGRNREALPIDPKSDTVLIYNIESGGKSRWSASGIEAAAALAGIKTYQDGGPLWPVLHLVFDTSRP